MKSIAKAARFAAVLVCLGTLPLLAQQQSYPGGGGSGGGIGGTVSTPFLPFASGADMLSDTLWQYGQDSGNDLDCYGSTACGIEAEGGGFFAELFPENGLELGDGTNLTRVLPGAHEDWQASTNNLALHAGINADGNGEFGIDANTGMDNDWLQFLTDGSTFTEFSVIFPTTGDECTSYLDGVDPAFVGCRQNNGMAEAYLQTDSGTTGTGRLLLGDESGIVAEQNGVGGAFQVNPLTVSTLPDVATAIGAYVSVSDSSAVVAEGQTCVGSGMVTALAFSNGTVWKCF